MTLWRHLGLVAMFVAVGCAGGAGRAATSGGAAAPAKEGKEQPVPEDLRRGVELAERIGPEIYLQDKASAIGTDVLMERVKSLEGLNLGGFLTVREGDEAGMPKPVYQVMFFTRESDPRIVFRVHVPFEVNAKPTIEELKPPAAAN